MHLSQKEAHSGEGKPSGAAGIEARQKGGGVMIKGCNLCFILMGMGSH